MVIPTTVFEHRLPIDPLLPELSSSLSAGHAVLTAPTGSGKTTRVPLALLDADWLRGQRMLILEPRRAAARLAAARMAAELGERVGERVGHQVRFERRVGPRTRVEVLTEGILTRRLQQDPELGGCGLLIFDEFHERNLQADLGLALALDLTELRDDLRILVMSATLDAAPIAALLGNAPILTGEGRAFPVSVHHAERAVTDPVAAAPAAVQRALSEQTGDILVFLPGAGEIQRMRTALDALPDLDVLPLHGSLPLAEQERALRPPPASARRRRVVLATDLAETSVTIEGIGVVIDTGLTRKPRFAPGVGLTRLVTQPIDHASAAQRSGRAGRLGPGVCIRLWTEAEHRSRPAQRGAEILSADLTPLVLELAVWGTREPRQLRWADPPPAGAWAQARELLERLELLDPHGAATAAGRRVAELPVHPRLGRMLTLAPNSSHTAAADLAALLSERDPLTAAPGAPRPIDLAPRLHAVAAFRDKRPTPGFDPRRLRAVEKAAAQLHRYRHERPVAVARHQASAAALLALAFPDRIARRRDGATIRPGSRAGVRYLLRNGVGAELPRDDALGVELWLVIADLEAGAGDHRIRGALALTETEVEQIAASAIETRRTLRWDSERKAAVARSERRLGAICLSSQPQPLAPTDDTLPLLLDAIARDLDQALKWTPSSCQLQCRAACVRQTLPDRDWPDLSSRWLSGHLEEWLGPWLQGKSRLADARALDLFEVLRQTMGWARASALDELAPTHWPTPAGNARPIDYCHRGQPALMVPLQELFGMAETPTIIDGRQPLLLHLLSPAGRPLQVTQDLAAFWAGAYADVRKEMRGRYPKHHWPEDPAGERPIRDGLKRRRKGSEQTG